MGRPLLEYLATTSHREHLTWLAFLEERWEEPSLSDYYLMQIAMEIRRVLAKNPNRIKLKDFLLESDKKREAKARKISVEEQTAISKAIWKARLGMGRDGQPKPGSTVLPKQKPLQDPPDGLGPQPPQQRPPRKRQPRSR